MAPTDAPGFRNAVIADPQGGVVAISAPVRCVTLATVPPPDGGIGSTPYPQALAGSVPRAACSLASSRR